MHVWLSRAIFLRREQEKILESAKALGRPSDRARKEAAAVRVRPDQSAGTPLRVCKSVCIEEKITEREVADYVASEE